MTAYETLKQQLRLEPKTWLITGVAGFIGSNLLEVLLKLNQRVVGLDNFSTGHQRNLDEVQTLVGPDQWTDFQFINGDIRNLDVCRRAMRYSHSPLAGEGRSEGSVDYVLHHAALGSVPRSIEDPITANQSNIDGFLNILVAARDANIKRLVYATSSSTYGDHPDLPKVEEKIGKPLSPYAVTKLVNELYAEVFASTYGFKAIGLRYFNIFGRRQDPEGAYAAVIPGWIAAMIKNEPVYINGDGETSRDFCYADNVVQANLLAATVADGAAVNQVYNVAAGQRTTLNQLYRTLQATLSAQFPRLASAAPVYRDFRAGDVRHSLADIDKAVKLLGYAPTHGVDAGLHEAMGWYLRFLNKKGSLNVDKFNKLTIQRQPYVSEDYETKGRFCSYWHQLDEIRKAMPHPVGHILVIGKGSGFIDSYLRQLGYDVATLDIDSALAPTYCASVLDMPLPDSSVDLVVCCQVLEHLPFKQFDIALGEIRRVLSPGGRLVLSLPDLTRTYKFLLQLPKLGQLAFVIPVPVPEFLKKPWTYNGEHYWNIGNKSYPVRLIAAHIESQGFTIERQFRVFEMSWHRFFIATAN